MPWVTTAARFGTASSNPSGRYEKADDRPSGTHTKLGFLIALFTLPGYDLPITRVFCYRWIQGPITDGPDQYYVVRIMPHGYRVPSALQRCARVAAALPTEPSIFLDTFQCPKLHTDQLTPKGETTFKLLQVFPPLLLVCFIKSSSRGMVDDLQGQPQPAQNQPTPRPQQGESNFGDSSGPLFSMYSKIAKEEDDEMAENWQKDADGILIFVGPLPIFIPLHT